MIPTYHVWYSRTMTTAPALPWPGSLNALLGDGIRSLDITADERALVISRYEALGVSLDDHWSATRGHNLIRAQGSFLLGTVVRNVHRNDDIDIDVVAMRDVDRTSVSQAELKADSGIAVKSFASSIGDYPGVSECHRCWTLQWPGMHLDLLPGLPNREPGESGLWITDKDVHQWLQSDPAGYATWFRRQMEQQLLAERQRVAMSKRLDVEEVPDWQVKTTLQQGVQALKRHRDIYFADHREDRPASIILTTLAALAYAGGDDLYEVLRDATARMADFVERIGGLWVVSNPVLAQENFADSWERHPSRAAWFFQWLEQATTDFNGFGNKLGLDFTIPKFGAVFGERFAKAASAGAGNSLYSASIDNRVYVASGGALAAAKLASTDRLVRGHGFAGGTRR